MDVVRSLEQFYTKSSFKSKNNIISINLNQSNNCYLHSLQSKYLVHIKFI